MITFFLIYSGCCLLVFALLFGSAKPYPKKWEEEENRELQKLFNEYDKQNSA
jgi:hypothetical protein